MKHNQLKAKVLSNPKTKAAYVAMIPQFARLRKVLKAQQNSA
jgi:threonine/homoserine/homoserine lactone efflux protein